MLSLVFFKVITNIFQKPEEKVVANGGKEDKWRISSYKGGKRKQKGERLRWVFTGACNWYRPHADRLRTENPNRLNGGFAGHG